MRSDRGSAPTELVVGLGLLVLPIAIAVLIAPAWVGARSRVELAAQTAARHVATGPGTTASEHEAVAMAVEIVTQRRLVGVETTLCPGRGTCLPLARDGVVVVQVSATVPAVDLPGVGSFGEVTVGARASAPVDPYRSLP